MRRRALLMCAVLLVLVAAAGCSAPPRSATTATPRPVPHLPAGTPISVNLNGLVVNVETTAGLGPDLSKGNAISPPLAPPAKGKVRVTVYAKAVNSTDTTLPVQIEHNLPRVQDSSGKNLTLVTGGTSAHGFTGGGHSTQLEGLKPGGTFEAVETFDLNPGQSGLRFAWNLGGAGEAKLMLP